MNYELEVRQRFGAGETIESIAEALKVTTCRIERALLGEYVVRVIYCRSVENTFPDFLECLQEAGTIKIHRDSDATICFDIMPPMELSSKDWSDKLAELMTERGFNAVRAPRWVE